jgi:hypothetical protein
MVECMAEKAFEKEIIRFCSFAIRRSNNLVISVESEEMEISIDFVIVKYLGTW